MLKFIIPLIVTSILFGVEIELKLSKSVEFEDIYPKLEILNLTFDPQDSSYYITDRRNLKVIKLDNNFKEIYKIGSKGSGPGEFNYIYQSVTYNDTLFVLDSGRFLKKFDKSSGDYLGELNSNNYRYQEAIQYRSGIVWDCMRGTPDWYKTYLLNTIESNIIIQKSADKVEGPGGRPSFANHNIIFDIENSSNTLYYSINQHKSYEIIGWDLDSSKQLFQINRPYIKVKEEDPRARRYREFKPSFNSFIALKGNYLLVSKNRNRDSRDRGKFLIDIFKDDRFLGETSLEIIEGESCREVGVDLYHLNGEIIVVDNGESKIEFYSYKIVE